MPNFTVIDSTPDNNVVISTSDEFSVITIPTEFTVEAIIGAGPQGPQGVAGAVGAQGPAGANGTNGADGVMPTAWQFNPTVGTTIMMFAGGTSTGAWGAPSHTNFFPFYVPAGFPKIDQFGFNCTTATASTTLTYGIYKVVGSNFERVLAGSADVSTTGMKMTSVTATQLDPGVYWLAVYYNNSGPAFTTITTPQVLSPIPNASANWGMRIQSTAPAATMACISANNGPVVASGVPLLYVRTSA